MLFPQGAAGTIQGVITDDIGKPLPHAHVIATPVAPAGGPSYAVLSGPSGQYNLTQVRPGKYTLCVQLPHSAYLDPCRWSTPTQVTVAAGQVAGKNDLRVAKGSLVRVRLNDPGNHLAKGEGGVLLGISGASSLFHPLSVAGSDSLGSTFDMAIPLNTSLRLTITSDRLQVADENGVALASVSNSLPIMQAPGQQDLVLTFTITGKK